MALDLKRFRALSRNWEAIGEADAFFGVLSNPTKHGGQWDTDEFFASGSAHVQKLIRTLQETGASFDGGVCLDFGCGVGRLTLPLATFFDRTVGVDVARSMITRANTFLRPEDRCEFVVNKYPDLRQFKAATFDMVHSCLVLQHIPPEVSLGYIAEFFRVSKPGGIVVFQIPAERIPESTISETYALPRSACAAVVAVLDPPASLAADSVTVVRVSVSNRGDVAWCHEIPAGRHICVGNHWISPDGAMVVQDDGRARLLRRVAPGERAELDLIVRAPAEPGAYELVVDLVQEKVCWFVEKGSQPARIPLQVVKAGELGRRMALNPDIVPQAAVPSVTARRPSLFTRLRHRLRGAAPTFEMHEIPRVEVERAIRSAGATLLKAIDDNAAAERWLSYTYICRSGAAQM